MGALGRRHVWSSGAKGIGRHAQIAIVLDSESRGTDQPGECAVGAQQNVVDDFVVRPDLAAFPRRLAFDIRPVELAVLSDRSVGHLRDWCSRPEVRADHGDKSSKARSYGPPAVVVVRFSVVPVPNAAL